MVYTSSFERINIQGAIFLSLVRGLSTMKELGMPGWEYPDGYRQPGRYERSRKENEIV